MLGEVGDRTVFPLRGREHHPIPRNINGLFLVAIQIGSGLPRWVDRPCAAADRPRKKQGKPTTVGRRPRPCAAHRPRTSTTPKPCEEAQ